MFDFQRVLEEGAAEVGMDTLGFFLFLSDVKKKNVKQVSGLLSDGLFDNVEVLDDVLSKIQPLVSVYMGEARKEKIKYVFLENSTKSWDFIGSDGSVFALIIPSNKREEVEVKTRSVLYDESGKVVGVNKEYSFTANKEQAVLVMGSLYSIQTKVQPGVSYISFKVGVCNGK